MKKFVDTFNVISGLLCILGIVLFYSGYMNYVYIIAGVSLVASWFNVTYGEQNNFSSELIAIFIGLVVASATHKQIAPYVAIAVCYESAILIVFSAPLMAFLGFIRMKRDERALGVSTKKTVNRSTFVITMVLLAGLSIGGAFYVSDYYKTQIHELNSKYNAINENYSLLSAKESNEQRELLYWQASAVLCTPAGEKYHHYGCPHLQGTEYTVMGRDEAIEKGYTPCFDCCETNSNIDWYGHKKQAELMDEQQRQQQREDFAKVKDNTDFINKMKQNAAAKGAAADQRHAESSRANTKSSAEQVQEQYAKQKAG